MLHRLAAMSLVAGLAGAAFAQNDGEAAASGEQLAGQMHSSGIPVGWEGDIANAFFEQGGVLLPEAELRSNWESLSAEDKEQVRSYCAALGTPTASRDSDAVTRTVLPSSGATGHGGPSEDGETATVDEAITEGKAAENSFVQASGNVAQIADLCSTVETL